MRKLFLLILPLLAVTFNSCSSDENHAEPGYPRSVSFNARFDLTTEINIDAKNWTIGDTHYNERETDILGSSIEIDLLTEKGWCTAEKKEDKLVITLTENKNEYKYRRCFFIAGNNHITITQYPFKHTQEELEPIANEYIAVAYDNIRFENGKLSYTGVDYPFELDVTLHKEIEKIEEFYPYSLHYNEIIKISGDDKKNLKVSGEVYITDYKWYYSSLGEYRWGNKAKSFSISVSGAYNNTFSYSPN